MAHNSFENLLTKQNYLDLAEDLCRPLLPCFTPNESTVHLPHRFRSNNHDDEEAIESFSRPLWGIAGLVKNGNHELGKTICTMIKNGINPDFNTYWGKLEDYSQIIVEMPAIAFFLYTNSNLLESEFSLYERQLLSEWLSQINEVKVWDNNWHFFPLMVNAVLLELNLGGSRDAIDSHWQVLDGYYLGNGWYRDGAASSRDYYVAWAYHFYSLLWMYIDSSMPDEIRESIIHRAETFAASFKLFFDGDGEAIPFGRSLIYRFAQVAFWSAYKLNGLKGQSDALVKGIISRNINWWLSKDIFNADGTLNLGYAYNNHLMTEPYNAEGSPYWAFKVFVLLLLPEEDSFWSAPAGGLGTEDKDAFIEKGHFFVSHNSGIASIYPYELASKAPWPIAVATYQKFVYSTRFGFCIARGFEKMEFVGADSSLAVAIDGFPWIVRHGAEEWRKISDNVFSSVWNIGPNTCIKTYLCIMGSWHIRIHQIRTGAPLMAADCGFSVPEPFINASEDNTMVMVSNVTEKLFSVAASLYGGGKASSYRPPANSNLLYPRTRVPYISKKFGSGSYLWANAFYGGSKEYKEIPFVTIGQNTIEITVGDKTTSLKMESSRKYAFRSNLSQPVKSILRKVRLKIGK